MNITESFYIGYISKTRGLKGELQFFFEFEDYRDLEFDVIFVEIEKKLVPFFVDQIKVQNNSTAYVNLEDVDHIDKAQALVRKKVYLPNDKMPVRDPEDFRYSDLVGYEVSDRVEGKLGIVTAVQELPQQHVATVDMEGKELMFPLTEQLIINVGKDDKLLEVDLPEGLVALYREV
ncbi:ribosome maturation factor RimM [Sphingobacterium sp. lm-10]|uniref:ribosome maturation factor RimM n=1 Tax=Sphingobacterium sp. lm-10 TaxID=2944904 RepID=UPI0020203148|nr:ribosome maturation factor RimM [Sphingobacterium sp. lm-10]MCL7989352.1 ribosome maturation factor RimM [Sphingobacterium sp. lm-10]